jgi:GNAT superfamily N-acetyltransferase
MKYHFDIQGYADSKDLEVLLNGLKAYNIEQTPAAIASNNINIFVKDENNKIVGGLKSYSYLQTLHVDYLYLDKELRNLGYGKRLLELAEAEAKKYHCKLIYLSTFSFQAPSFYQKLGYEIFAELELPTGDKRYYLKKAIA